MCRYAVLLTHLQQDTIITAGSSDVLLEKPTHSLLLQHLLPHLSSSRLRLCDVYIQLSRDTLQTSLMFTKETHRVETAARWCGLFYSHVNMWSFFIRTELDNRLNAMFTISLMLVKCWFVIWGFIAVYSQENWFVDIRMSCAGFISSVIRTTLTQTLTSIWSFTLSSGPDLTH